MRRIKENISKEEFELLIRYLRVDNTIRDIRRDRLLKLFHLLWFLGIRVNETTQFTNNMMIELLQEKKLIIKSHKQGSEKLVYLTDSSQKILKKIFCDIKSNDNYIFVSERSKKSTLESASVIRDVNTYIRKVFGSKSRITSHSFRRSLISELAVRGVNIKVIQNLISHKSINTTYRYITTSETDLTDSLSTIR